MNNENIDNSESSNTSGHISLQQVVSGNDIKVEEPITIQGTDNNINTSTSISSSDISPIKEDNDSSQSNNYVNPQNKKTFVTDSELLYNFIGNNYQKIIMGKFNFSAFLLSFIYLLYRKMYFYSFLVMLIYVIVPIFIKNTLYLCGIFLVINFILGLVVNKLYLKHCDNKINNIRYKFSFYDNDSVRNECKKAGGTSIISVIIGLIINIGITVLFMGLYLYFIDKVQLSDMFKKIIDFYIKNSTG